MPRSAPSILKEGETETGRWVVKVRVKGEERRERERLTLRCVLVYMRRDGFLIHLTLTKSKPINV